MGESVLRFCTGWCDKRGGGVYVDCADQNRFGAVLEEFEVRDALERVFASKGQGQAQLPVRSASGTAMET
jgi:hypothetical protein